MRISKCIQYPFQSLCCFALRSEFLCIILQAFPRFAHLNLANLLYSALTSCNHWCASPCMEDLRGWGWDQKMFTFNAPRAFNAIFDTNFKTSQFCRLPLQVLVHGFWRDYAWRFACKRCQRSKGLSYAPCAAFTESNHPTLPQNLPRRNRNLDQIVAKQNKTKKIIHSIHMIYCNILALRTAEISSANKYNSFSYRKGKSEF